MGLFFVVSTLRLNAVVHPFDLFLVKGLLECGFWNAILESMGCIHQCVIQTEGLLVSWKPPEIIRAIMGWGWGGALR